MISFIRQYTKSSFIAEEVLQEAYLEALKQADHIKHPDKLISWLKTVAKRISIEQLKKYNLLIKKCRVNIVHSHGTWEDELIERMVIAEMLEKALRDFPSYYRQVINYRYTYNMPYAQIAETLGITVGAARQANSRIIRRIRESL